MTAQATPAAIGSRIPAARVNYSFAPGGGYAACITFYEHSRPVIERMSLADSRTICTSLHEEEGLPQILCLDDGSVLVVRLGAEAPRLNILRADGDVLVEHDLITIDGPGFRVLHTPDPRSLAFAICSTGNGTSAIMDIPAEGHAPRRIVELEGIAGHCNWLDHDGSRLAVNVTADGRSTPIEVDISTGSVCRLDGTSTGQHLLLASPASGLRVLATPVDGSLRLTYTTGLNCAPVVSVSLEKESGSAAPVAVDPDGRHVALRVERGARSRIVVHTPETDELRELDLPAGTVGSVAAWTRRGLSIPFSSPTRPPEVMTIHGVPRPRAQLTSSAPSARSWADAHLHEFDGECGPIEAVTYGDWRHAERLLIHLHGGPESAARLDFDLMAQSLATAGVAVISPNYRGSTGYGHAHAAALHHHWGGPDLDDVRSVARQVTELRHPVGQLMLMGESYGAFLALLAAAVDPDLWSHCVAVAPFLSGPALYSDGSPGVRALIDRLGGRTPMDDELGPRDLTSLASRITADVLVMHGSDDPVIPVRHARELYDLLMQAADDEARIGYIEAPHGGHDPFSGPDASKNAERVIDFLTFPSERTEYAHLDRRSTDGH